MRHRAKRASSRHRARSVARLALALARARAASPHITPFVSSSSNDERMLDRGRSTVARRPWSSSTSSIEGLAERHSRAMLRSGRRARATPPTRAFALALSIASANEAKDASVVNVARVARASKALAIERASGMADARGARGTFSEYAKFELASLAEAFANESEVKKEWERVCAKRFAMYKSLTAKEREEVVSAGEALLANANAKTETETETETKEREEREGESAEPRWQKKGKQSIIEGDAWEHALEQGQIRRREVEAVMRNAGGASTSDDDILGTSGGNQDQGSGVWFQLRASRLTASAFSNAIGFWKEGRNELWEEKLGLRDGFAGNEATEWGSSHEDEAVKIYESFAQKKVSHLLFHLLSSDEAELWIGASPDGLIGTNAADTAGHPGGVLEVKCPFNKGRPLQAKPYPTVPWYYIPQVQGLMAVFDRPWVDVFCFTVAGGCAVYRVERDREYWALMYSALSDFWWQNVIPGKHALAAGKDVERYRPNGEHPTCTKLKEWSKDISKSSATTFISAQQVEEIRKRL